jgi:hypothetical protein
LKYIVFTCDGYGLPIAQHLLEEGNEVVVGQVESKKSTLTKVESRSNGEEYHVDQKRRLNLYKNMIEKVSADILIKRLKRIKNPQEYFVFFDFNSLFRYADQIRDMGFNGNFPNEKDRIFEIDRDAAKEFVSKYYPEVEVTEKKEFRAISGAKKFLKDSKKVWVVKSKGQNGETLIPQTKDPELAKWQVIETLEAFKNAYEEVGFLLEEKIPSPIEVTPELIFYDGVPLALTVNFENKTLGSGNLSLQTSCAADLVFPIDFDSRICEIAFPPIVYKIAKRHKGLFFWDASLLIDKNTGRIFFGEFCPNRAGYNSTFTYLSQMPSVSHFFESVVAKKSPFVIGTVGASVSLFNLSRDPEERHVLSGASISFPERIRKSVWLYDVYKKTKNDKVRVVGFDWELSAITGTGYTLDEAVNNLYGNVESFSIGTVYYRPKSDYLSMDYESSIVNRLRYCVGKKLFEIPFRGVY